MVCTTENRRGAVLILCAISLVVLLGICALVIDLGIAYVADAELQNAADAAAMAGAGKLRERLDQEATKEEAIAIAAANTVLGDSQIVSYGDVVVGSWNTTTQQIIPWNETNGAFAVQVTARRTTGSANGPVPTFFARIFGIHSTDMTCTAIAGVEARLQARRAVSIMVVQDGSSSFQNAWSKAMEADTALFGLVNGVSVTNDCMGIVTFTAKLPDSYLRQAGLYNSYQQNPGMNEGIKYTTDSSGRPRKTNAQGVSDSHGLVRPMTGPLTSFDPDNHSVLPTGLDTAGKLVKNGICWGDTDTSAGLNYAIDRLQLANPDTDKVIVLFSDGKPHSVADGGHGAATQALEVAAVAAADRAAALGIRIHTVTLEGTHGANFEFNEGLVRNGGAALRAANADQLRGLLIAVGTIEVGRPRLFK